MIMQRISEQYRPEKDVVGDEILITVAIAIYDTVGIGMRARHVVGHKVKCSAGVSS